MVKEEMKVKEAKKSPKKMIIMFNIIELIVFTTRYFDYLNYE